tara:strand:- start:1366 stop:2706 length:1341 start_codon:yes stop_codon:yes gene_type:complete
LRPDDGNPPTKQNINKIKEVSTSQPAPVSQSVTLKPSPFSSTAPKKSKIPKNDKSEKKTSPQFTLSSNLKQLGNQKACTDLIAHLSGDSSHLPILVHGPTGCGKTLGVQECLRIMGMHFTLLDGSVPEDPNELKIWMDQVLLNSTIDEDKQKGTLFIDDFESFTEKCREVVLKYVKKTSKNRNPMVITCTNLYSYELKQLQQEFRSKPTVRFWPPRIDVIESFFKRKGYTQPIIEKFSTTFDLRAIENSLKWYYRFRGKLSTIDKSYNIFERTNKLLVKKYDNTTDACFDNSLVRVVYDNLSILSTEPTRHKLLDPLTTHSNVINSLVDVEWNSLPEFFTVFEKSVNNYLGCRTITNKYKLEPEKKIKKSFDYDIMENIIDNKLRRCTTEEAFDILDDYCDRNLNSRISTDDPESVIRKLDSMKLVGKTNLYDVPSILGGPKFSFS